MTTHIKTDTGAYAEFAAWHARKWSHVYRCPPLAELECPVEDAVKYYQQMYEHFARYGTN